MQADDLGHDRQPEARAALSVGDLERREEIGAQRAPGCRDRYPSRR